MNLCMKATNSGLINSKSCVQEKEVEDGILRAVLISNAESLCVLIQEAEKNLGKAHANLTKLQVF